MTGPRVSLSKVGITTRACLSKHSHTIHNFQTLCNLPTEDHHRQVGLPR